MMRARRFGGWAVRGTVLVLGALVVACSRKPPADFAPDPGLVSELRQIRINTMSGRACPGAMIAADYVGVHESGLHMPFERRYDRDRPPRLHISFLTMTSPDAGAREDGNWVAHPDPLRTAMTGFRLNAFLRARPSVNGATTLEPEYSCLPMAHVFEGQAGQDGGAGLGGPDITVRVGYLRSPYYDRLLVAAIEVGTDEPRYLLADADRAPPADWILVESRGGRGGRGRPGARGQPGAAGAAGCPGAQGGPGGPGGPAGPGGPGGAGGRITVIVPADEPLLAGLVEGQSVGGRGGDGGPGGQGGQGGRGGAAQGTPPAGQTCQAGANGPEGQRGPNGQRGANGPSGFRPQVLTVSRAELWGAYPRPELRQLLDFTAGNR
jgi:hypothetical protein